MKIEIEQIQKELEEKFPVQKVAVGYEIDKDQLTYIDNLIKETYETIKENVYSEVFNMFDYSTFINEFKHPEQKFHVARLSEVITEKALCVFLMNPEYFEQHFGSSKWFKSLHEKYHNEFFGGEPTQYQGRIWYRKLRPRPKSQLALFNFGEAAH